MHERGGIIRRLQELVRWLNRCSSVSIFNLGLALLFVPTIFGLLLLRSLGLVPRMSYFNYSFRDNLIYEASGVMVRVTIVAGLGLWLFVAGRAVVQVTRRLRKAGTRSRSTQDGPPESA